MKTIRPGQIIYWRNQAAIVLELKGVSELILRTLEHNETVIAQVKDLSMGPVSDAPPTGRHLFGAEKEWDKAVERFELIRPLLDKPLRGKEDVQKVATAAGKSVVTIYRWINRFKETGLVSSLLRPPRSDKEVLKISKEVEDIIALKIDEVYLAKERVSVRKLHDEIKEACKAVDLTPPHLNTIYARVEAIDQRELLSKRVSPKAARNKFEPLRGKFPDPGYPNAVVQIDHTPMDIVVVDDEHRLPIDRPYLTAAIDVNTKMLAGFRITLDPPSALSAGLCIAHAVMRKDYWLAKRDIFEDWPFYGKMDKIHLDNAKEFRGKMLERACKQYGIKREFRPKGQPNYGPHIERAFRTFMSEVHTLEGTTFSNVQAKLEYDSEGRACMTLSELETWFTVFIVYCYHHRPHKGICDIPPIKAYYNCIHGSDKKPGVGLPAPIDDEETFRLTFTPYVERSIQREGVVIDKIHYFAPILRRWVCATNPERPEKAQLFIFARDPRDLSIIYFLDPDTHTYSPIPYLNNTRPPISLWELKATTRELKKDPANQVNEEMIFKGIRKMRQIEQEAIEKTRLAKQQRATEKRARTMKQRRAGWEGVHPSKIKVSLPPTEAPSDDDDIQPFSDIELS